MCIYLYSFCLFRLDSQFRADLYLYLIPISEVSGSSLTHSTSQISLILPILPRPLYNYLWQLMFATTINTKYFFQIKSYEDGDSVDFSGKTTVKTTRTSTRTTTFDGETTTEYESFSGMENIDQKFGDLQHGM